MGNPIEILKKTAKWSYFIMTILAIIGAFIHLHVRLQTYNCHKMIDIERLTKNVVCIGRNIIWAKSNTFDDDYNQNAWRQIFSLNPDIFIDTYA